MDKEITIEVTNPRGSKRTHTGTINYLVNEVFGYTLEVGKSWEHEPGNGKVNMNPRSGKTLVKALNVAKNNSASNGYSGTRYKEI